jgi:2-dehydro-3-deoxyphosphogluconate aldolase/(4S)-4-hydroxy-2-oxoglutarate aldolase
LKALAGPFPDVVFCPTGGLNPDNFRSFLALPNVVCCGGSWMVAPELVRDRQWEMIKVLAQQALAD